MISTNSPVGLIPELTDLFVDHLWDDKHALVCCSLVAKSWVSRSHFHLFHSISVRTIKDLQGFRDIISSMPACRHIQRLTLGIPLLDIQESNYRLSPSYISSLLRSLPALRQFTAFCMWWDSTEETEPSPTPKGSPSFSSLPCSIFLVDISSTHPDAYGKPLSLNELFSLVHLFPKVGELSYGSSSRHTKHNLAPSQLVPRHPTAKNLRLQALTLQSRYLETPILQFIAQTESMQSLQCLEIYLWSLEATIAAQELLRKTTATLKVLRILGLGPPTADEARLASQALDLSVCPDLREFEFRMPMNGADQTRRVHWLVLCTLLQHISPRTNPKLQLHLILSFKSISWDKVKSVVEDLELMSSTLLGQLLRQVVSVDITIKSDSSTGGTAYIQSELLFHAFDMAFPRLVEEGRLRYKRVVC